MEGGHRAYLDAFVVVTGCADGADAIARETAAEMGVPCVVERADWAGLGRRAGPERNARIVAGADACMAFWDGRSPGTRDCIEQFVRAGKSVRIIARQGGV